MVNIQISTSIAADIPRCFDLSRSIDLHLKSGLQAEEAIAGVTTGLIGAGEQLTWRAQVFGIRVKHTTLISDFQPPRYFQDKMVSGVFHYYCHDHYFSDQNGATRMLDIVELSAPLGILGWAVEQVWLRQYMTDLIERRARHIKQVAESQDWREYVRA
jgi:ligand-binding SRPBCC domain-containing protein